MKLIFEGKLVSAQIKVLVLKAPLYKLAVYVFNSQVQLQKSIDGLVASWGFREIEILANGVLGLEGGAILQVYEAEILAEPFSRAVIVKDKEGITKIKLCQDAAAALAIAEETRVSGFGSEIAELRAVLPPTSGRNQLRWRLPLAGSPVATLGVARADDSLRRAAEPDAVTAHLKWITDLVQKTQSQNVRRQKSYTLLIEICPKCQDHPLTLRKIEDSTDEKFCLACENLGFLREARKNEPPNLGAGI
jgi:hypothetical protein